jgi:hypothetical protein
MNFQEIEMKGKFWVQVLSTTPSWTAADEGRIIYAQDTDRVYFADDTGWQIFTSGNNSGYISATSADSHAGTITPTSDDSINLGAVALRYANVYAVNFVGTTSAATYSDLAEKYTTKEKYPTGTVMCVSKDAEYELEAVNSLMNPVIGVISEAPGFLLNQELEDGQIIGLTGKVPIKIFGKINKGDFIVPHTNGLGRKGTQFEREYMFAVALETNPTDSERMIMSIIK